MVLGPKGAGVGDSVTRDHYARLAASYDENWAHSPAFVEWMTGLIRQHLKITSTDVVADIGCGTGLFARGLVGSASTVVCIDSSAPMLAQLPDDEHLVPVNSSAEDVAGGSAVLPYGGFDAMLLKEVLHHVGDRAEVIGGLARLLRPGGRMLVIMLPTRISYPLFADALALFSEQQPDPESVVEDMRGSGLAAELNYESFPLRFSAERYERVVRNRYMSLLSQFDDEQLEAGIAEIRVAHPGDEFEFDDTFALVLGTKP